MGEGLVISGARQRFREEMHAPDFSDFELRP